MRISKPRRHESGPLEDEIRWAPQYSEKAELDPYAVSGKVSLALLEELMATASIIGRV